MKNQYFKKYKLNQLQNIKQSYKYMYLFRYNDLNINEIILIKKKLKKLNYKFLVLKQNLMKKSFVKIKGQGSLLIIYGNENVNIFEIVNFFKKIELIFLQIDKNIYSNLKLKTIFKNNNTLLNFIIIKPLFNFIYVLKNIKKASIT